MARNTSRVNQQNLWGRTATEAYGLEPQRQDLFIVDFSTAVKGIYQSSGIRVGPVIPQYVRSIQLPDNRLRTEAIRRDSVAYQTPSWDDALDPIKIQFLLDTKEQDNRSIVREFLEAWLVLTRAGRGTRKFGYAPTQGYLLLNRDYRVDYQFNVNLLLLRGASTSFSGFYETDQDQAAEWAAQLNRRLTVANTNFRNAHTAAALTARGKSLGTLPTQSEELVRAYELIGDAALFEQDMVVHSTIVLSNAWLASYRFNEFSHEQGGLAVLEATFCADAVESERVPLVSGQAAVLP